MLGPRQLTRVPVTATSAQSEVYEQVRDRGGPVTLAELAEESGQHVNTLREHLDALVHLGLLTRQRRTPGGRGRPAHEYSVRPERAGDTAQGAFLDAVIGHLAVTSAALGELAERLGRDYAAADPIREDCVGAVDTRVDRPAGGPADGPGGRRQHDRGSNQVLDARMRVAEVMDHLGFSPQLTGDGAALLLRTCPLLGSARRHRDVVCGFHRGVVRGVAEGVDPEVKSPRLVPFAEIGSCRIEFVVSGVGHGSDA